MYRNVRVLVRQSQKIEGSLGLVRFVSIKVLDFGLKNTQSSHIYNRCMSAQIKSKPLDKNATKPEKAQIQNHSFVHNLFRGKVEHSQAFPFPIALDQEQVEYVGAFVDPVTKFFTEVNDASRNDQNAVSWHSRIFWRSLLK
jgi:hypothetical protein